MIPQKLQFTEEEQETFKIAEESESFILSPVWRRLEVFLADHVEEALDSIRGNQSSDPKVALHFERIWKEREQIRDGIIRFVKSPIKQRKEMLEQIEQLKKEGAVYA